MKKNRNYVIEMIESFINANMFISSGATISLCFLLSVRQAEKENVPQNKSQLISSIPCGLGSLTRKRAVLERLIYVGALCVKTGNKKSEKLVFLTDRSKALLSKSRA